MGPLPLEHPTALRHPFSWGPRGEVWGTRPPGTSLSLWAVAGQGAISAASQNGRGLRLINYLFLKFLPSIFRPWLWVTETSESETANKW